MKFFIIIVFFIH